MNFKKILNININLKTEKESFNTNKEKILSFLNELRILEAKLWGVYINDSLSETEDILEDTNHLIYLISRNKDKEILNLISEKERDFFLKELNNAKKGFKLLKEKIEHEDMLKKLISEFTIKLVNDENFNYLKDIFFLEKLLYEVLEIQHQDLLIFEMNFPKIDFKQNPEILLTSLKKLREILSGPMELNKFFSDERKSFSVVSNILHKLIEIISKINYE
jgi:hypothetical protein